MSHPVAKRPAGAGGLPQDTGLQAGHPALSYTFGPQAFGYYACGIACLALILTASGAYDTGHLSIPHRLGLWSTVSALIVLQAAAIDRALQKLMPAGRGFRFLGAAVALALTILFVTLELHALKYTPLLPKKPDPLLAFLVFVSLPVSAIAGFVILTRLRTAAPRRTAMAATAEIPLKPKEQSTGFRDWPASAITLVKANDHYLEIWSEEGSCFSRGRMADAITHLGTADGLQVHRSWWVARKRVRNVERQGRDYVIVTGDGLRIPVGRSRVRALRKAGWIS